MCEIAGSVCIYHAGISRVMIASVGSRGGTGCIADLTKTATFFATSYEILLIVYHSATKLESVPRPLIGWQLQPNRVMETSISRPTDDKCNGY